MPLTKLVFKPGVNRDQTNYASEGGWFDMDKVRFRSGFPEKIGGWRVELLDDYIGVARNIFAWSSSDGVELVAICTNEKIYVSAGSALYDITPIRATYTHATVPSTDNCFATTNGSTTVTVTLNSHGAAEGDWVTFSGATGPVNGVPAADLNLEFKISNVTTNTFDITVATTATGTGSGGGTAITAAFQISIGYETNIAGYGWGTSTWSRLTWGSGSTIPLYKPARLEFSDNFNADLIFNIMGSDIYIWEYTSNFNTRGVLLSSIVGASAVPQQVTKIMFAPTGHLIAFGGTEYDAGGSPPDYAGPYNPLVVRWADVNTDTGPVPEMWAPSTTNTAGFAYIKSGSGIVTGVRTRQEILVFSDTSLTSMQFLGTSEVFAFQELSNHISIFGPNVVVSTNNITYWMGRNKFYVYSGSTDTLPCTVRQYVFDNINSAQGSLFFGGSNDQFNEIIWFYCSANSNDIDRYVIYNYSDNVWYFGNLARTAWLDTGVVEYPLATNDGWVYKHELGRDDGQPLGAAPLPIEAYIQSADVDIDDGDKYLLVRRVIPDVNFTGSDSANYVTGTAVTPEATITVGVRNFPGAANSTTNASGISMARQVVTTAVIDQYTNQVFVRGRGRQMNFKIASDGIGVQWQLGMPRVDARPDGMKS